jgi:hypothetical protein
MTFNHNTNSLPDALGVEQHKYASQLATIMTLVSSNGFDRASKISEMMHRCVDYNILLMLATNRLLNMMEDFQNKDTFNLSEN